jgi:hypothetical protein
MNCHIIKKVALGHCQRGTDICIRCREAYAVKYCLLNICPKGEFARRVIEIEIDGSKQWKEFDIEKVFETPDMAKEYADKNLIRLIKEGTLPQDKQIDQLMTKVPENWQVKLDEDYLTLSRKDFIYTLFENQLNQPVSRETKQQENERIQKYGKKIYPQMGFRIEPKWFPERYKLVKKNNDSILALIYQLPKKYNIIHLRDSLLSRKGNEVYNAKTRDDKENIKNYLNEKESDLKLIQQMPDFQSEKYQYFLIQKSGGYNEYTLVYPENALSEMYQLDTIIDSIFTRTN